MASELLAAGEMRQLMAGGVEQAERAMLTQEQADCPVFHHFGPGVYIRELHMRAGTYAIGHRQRQTHLNILLKGRVLMLNADGSTTELVAPMTFVTQPGRKMGYVLEDMVWQNVYATEERSIDALEARLLDKSPVWQDADTQARADAWLARDVDRADYLQVLDESGFSHAQALAQSENPDDQIDLPQGYSVRVLASAIDGLGLFATAPVEPGQVIAPARIDGKRTPAGRYTNHSANPNAQMVRRGDDINLVALCRINGCRGGEQGEEVTIDYRQALSLSGVHRIKEQTA